MTGIEAIKRYRKREGLTLVALAEQLGRTKSTIWRWENGRRRPRLSDVREISEKTGIPQIELVGLDGGDS